MSGLHRFTRGSAVVGVLVAMVVGLPLLLWFLIGWPLPQAMPTWNEISVSLKQNGVPDTALLDAIAITCWMLWATFTVSLLFEIVAAARGRVVRRVALVSPVQLLAAALVSTLVMSFASNAKSAPTIPIETYITTMQPASAAFPLSTSDLPAAAESAVVSTTIPYTVVRRDTLWGISERHLGDATRWKEIYSLNKDKRQADGRSLVDADMIRPGWILQLPSDAAVQTSSIAASAPQETVEIAPITEAQSTPIESSANESQANAVVTTTSIAPSPDVESTTAEVMEKQGISLASSSIVPLSLISGLGTALVTLRLRRRSRRPLSNPTPGMSWAEPLVDDTIKDVRRHDLDIELSALGLQDESTDVYVPTRPNALEQVETIELTVRPHNEVRPILVDALASSNCDVVIAGADLATSLIGNPASFEGLDIVDAKDALQRVDEAMLSRSRTLVDADIEDVSAYRHAFPGEPMPTKLFVLGNSDSDLVEKAQSYVDRAGKYDVVLVLVDVETATIDVRETSPFAYSLNADETRSMVDVVRASRLDFEECEEAPVEPFIVPSNTVETHRAIQVSVFGPVRIVAQGEEIKSGLRGKARELLAFLALRPQGATWDVIGAALWPEANGKQANERFRTTLGNLRKTLRDATSSKEKFVDLIGERYVLDASQFDCDVWQFQSALTDAVAESADVSNALQRAVEAYSGELAEGSYYEWAEAPREDMRRRVLDALGRLAELHQRDGNATAALSALERAIALDPYVEEVYQRVMAIQNEAGHRDAVVRTYRLLERRLSEIDVEPTERTMSILRDSAA